MLEGGIIILCFCAGGALPILFWIGDSLHSIKLALEAQPNASRVAHPFRGLRKTEETET